MLLEDDELSLEALDALDVETDETELAEELSLDALDTLELLAELELGLETLDALEREDGLEL